MAPEQDEEPQPDGVDGAALVETPPAVALGGGRASVPEMEGYKWSPQGRKMQ
ncbi:MAG: hypothetical protein R2762_14300 [Bryobacteraceae bacterium]